jgi:hypothetical protein
MLNLARAQTRVAAVGKSSLTVSAENIGLRLPFGTLGGVPLVSVCGGGSREGRFPATCDSVRGGTRSDFR